jgi:hypothetical protein
MKNKKELLTEISQLTLEIENDFPELYNFLDEMPDTLPVEQHPTMSESVLQKHLESLQQLMDSYGKTHTSRNSKNAN